MAQVTGPGIGNIAYGYDSDGVTKYLDDIHSEYLKEAEDAVREQAPIEAICKSRWEGKARDRFLNNFKNDGEHLCEQFETLYKILEKELLNVKASMAKKDAEMIQ